MKLHYQGALYLFATFAFLCKKTEATQFCGDNGGIGIDTENNELEDPVFCNGSPNGPFKFIWANIICGGGTFSDAFNLIVSSGADALLTTSTQSCDSNALTSGAGASAEFGGGTSNINVEFQCGNIATDNKCTSLLFFALVDCGCPDGQQVVNECFAEIDSDLGAGNSVREAMDATCAPNPTSPPPTSPPPTSPAPGTPVPTMAPSQAPVPCFSGETTVQVRDATDHTVLMKDLKVGDDVLTKSGTYQSMYVWAHMDHTKPTDFLQIHTSDRSTPPLEITEKHLVYVTGKASPVRADSLKIGDILSGDIEQKVVKVTKVKRNGFYGPLTPDGTIAVAGVMSSTYTDEQGKKNEYWELGGFSLPLLQTAMVHTFWSPLRLLCMGVSSKMCDYYDDEGYTYWGSFGKRLIQFAEQSLFFQVLVYMPLILGSGACMAVEYIFGPTYGVMIMFVGFVVAYPWYKKKMAGVGGGATKNKSV